jgi:hypothetical protein
MFFVPLPCAGHLLFILLLLCLLELVTLNTGSQKTCAVLVFHALQKKKLKEFNP